VINKKPKINKKKVY